VYVEGSCSPVAVTNCVSIWNTAIGIHSLLHGSAFAFVNQLSGAYISVVCASVPKSNISYMKYASAASITSSTNSSGNQSILLRALHAEH
jgi:hypothetical protein